MDELKKQARHLKIGTLLSCLGLILGVETIYHSLVNNVYPDQINLYIIALIFSLILISIGYILLKVFEDK